jgi:ankyrin repeat protein
MAAAYVGALELARDLIERGADLAVQDEEGFSALMYAANGGQDELVGLGLGLALR